MRRTKLIVTVGPATDSGPAIRRLVDCGVDVVRLNFSHGTPDGHAAIARLVRIAADAANRDVAILADLSGPKIRVGDLGSSQIDLREGDEVVLVRTTGTGGHASDGADAGDAGDGAGRPPIPVAYEHLVEDAEAGDRVLLDDGLIELVIDEVTETTVVTTCRRGGRLLSRKGVTFPDRELSARAPTSKDLEHARFAADMGVDYIALSFVQRAEDISDLKAALAETDRAIPVVAKLERAAALNNLDEIIQAADAVMVARGDLGIETDLAMVPVYQKQIIRACNIAGVPVITATQMLESMRHAAIPTRAETTDVANAIYDGSDAVMLSAETATGDYPFLAVAMIDRIARNVERHVGLDLSWSRRVDDLAETEVAVAQAVCRAADNLSARWIVAHTLSGRTARIIAQFRPRTPILALTVDPGTSRRLALVWGISSSVVPEFEPSQVDVTAHTQRVLGQRSLADTGDIVVITSGRRSGSGTTNELRVHRIE